MPKTSLSSIKLNNFLMISKMRLIDLKKRKTKEEIKVMQGLSYQLPSEHPEMLADTDQEGPSQELTQRASLNSRERSKVKELTKLSSGLLNTKNYSRRS